MSAAQRDTAEKVAIIGIGYVGLPLAIRAAEVGYTVVGLDADASRVTQLRGGSSFLNDIEDRRLSRVVECGVFRPFGTFEPAGPAALDGFDIAVITVPTPLRHGEPDLSYVEQAARLVGRHLTPGSTVILESSSYPGTTDGLVAEAIAIESGMHPWTDYHLGYSPERISPGVRGHGLEETPKLVAGTDAAALAAVDRFYSKIVQRTVPVSSTATAEFTKVFENIFSHVNVALVNELSVVAREWGIDIWEVIAAAETKGHSFLAHTPGPGVGGHCLPVDPVYLSWLARTDLGRRLELIETAQTINATRPEYVVDRAAALIGPLLAKSVLLLGAAYKPGVGDVRESPAIAITRLLQSSGAAVTISDPFVERWPYSPAISVDEASARAGDFDLTIVVTDHLEFDYAKVAETAACVLDCRNAMAPSQTVHAL